jgi:hypothetical protein
VLPKGTTFIRDRHIWFNLTEPTSANSFVLCVNLTTMDEECVDDECRLSHSDYRWVEQGDIPKATLAKVIKAATTSRELSPDFKTLL